MQFIDLVHTDQGTATLDQVAVGPVKGQRGKYRASFRLTQHAPDRAQDGDDSEVLPGCVSMYQEGWEESRSGGYTMRRTPIGIGETTTLSLSINDGADLELLLQKATAEVRQVALVGTEKRARVEWLVGVTMGAEVLGLIRNEGRGVLVTSTELDLSEDEGADALEAAPGGEEEVDELDNLPPEPDVAAADKADAAEKARRASAKRRSKASKEAAAAVA